MDKLKPIAVRSFKDVYKLLFETQTDLLNCEQVAAGYNGMIIDLTTRAAEADALRYSLRMWATLWEHIQNVTGKDYLPNESNFDLMIAELRSTVAAQAQAIETAREAILYVHGDCSGSCFDPDNPCPAGMWLAANAPTPTQGETEVEA